jgi:hypothetical protein
MMREQRKLTFYIGVLYCPSAFVEEIATAACHISGGCTVSYAKGLWMEEAGHLRSTSYTGEPKQETCLRIEVTCETKKVDGAYYDIRAAIGWAAETYGTDTNWVHVTDEEVIGRHFSVKDDRGIEEENNYD